MTVFRIFWITFAVVFGTFLLLFLMTDRAKAGYCASWVKAGYRCASNYSLDFGPSCRWQRAYCRRWVHTDHDDDRRHYRHRGRDAEIYYGNSERGGYRPSCAQTQLSVVGDASITEDGAKAQAEQSWTREVRWRYGAAYGDLSNARNLNWECGRSSVRNIPGTTRPLQFTCDISAVPCRAQKQREEKVMVPPPPPGERP